MMVEGVDCPEEVAIIEKALKPIEGVQSVSVSIMNGKTLVVHDATVQPARLLEAIQQSGLRASFDLEPKVTAAPINKKQACAVALSGLFTLLGLLFKWSGYHFTTVEILTFGIGIIAGAFLIFPKFIRALRQLSLDMNVLMTLAVIGAIIVDQWAEGAAVIARDEKVGATRVVLKAPANFTLPPFWFASQGTYTVLKGTFVFEGVDADGEPTHVAQGPGSFALVPANLIQRAATKGDEEALLYITVYGDWSPRFAQGAWKTPALRASST